MQSDNEPTPPQAEVTAKQSGAGVSPLVPVILAALFWCYLLISGAMDISMFIRFMSRTAAEAIWLLAFLTWWLTRSRVRWSNRLVSVAIPIVIGLAIAAI